MKIREVNENKKQFIALLLLDDEQENMIDFLASKYADEYSILQVGTGDSPLTVPFYEKCGFVRSHNIPNFFTGNYDHPIYESGVQLIDMVYLQRCL